MLHTNTGDTTYRLPTPEELTHPAADMTVDLTRHSVWTRSRTHTLLHHSPEMPSPYTPDYQQLQALPAADRQRVADYLCLLAIRPLQRRRVEAWAEVVATALRQSPDRDLNHALEQPASDNSVARILALVRVRTLIRARDICHARDTNRARAVAPRLHLNPASSRTGVLNQALHLAIDHASRLNLNLNYARDLDLNVAGERNRDLDLARYLDNDLSHALNSPHDYARAPEPDSTRDLAPESIRDLAPYLGPDPDLALARTLDRDVVYSSPLATPLSPHLDLAIDLAIDRARDLDLNANLSTHGSAPEVVFTALKSLIADHTTDAIALITKLDDLLTRTGTNRAHFKPPTPEDPAETLRKFPDLFQTPDRTAQHHLLTAQQLIDQTVELLRAIRDRRLPAHTHILACIRTTLLATASLLQSTGHPTREVALLHRTWQSLASYNQPGNQILLVVRTQP